ncbi:hypothetical protein Pmani_011282 [Petrolisthes manimaculis]|uniref:Endonuclease/exonuclease/phosphatase domain-containing protein n=1 Tax=Petrolisthes manimaculis TaxID=1843537 RepID=A0AAE1UFV0_9EUCA|nr:hypothetical protein Pmani_011282 [Petrolisthes manimaculis]
MDNKKGGNNTDQRLRVYYTNVDNSVLSKYEELIELTINDKYDIILLTKIKPKFGQIPDIPTMNIPGYNLYTNDLHVTNTRGVSVYVRSTLNSKRTIPILTNTYNDSVWIIVNGSRNSELLIGCVYRSGSPEVALQYETNLHETLIWAANTACSHKLIAGDFNHPGITWTLAPELPERVNTSSPQSKFEECVRDSYLFQHITKPTRYRSQQTPTLDDLVFTNEREMIVNMLRLDPLGASDHTGISADFLFTPSSPPMNKTTPNYNRGDYESLRNALDIEWKRELAGLITQEMTNIIEKNITDAVKKHIPTRKHQTTSGDYTRKPLWMTRTAYQKTKRKRNLWIRYLNTKDNSDYQQYIKARNEATHANRRARRDFETKLAQESRHNTKTFWNYVNSRRVVKGSISDLQDPQGQYVKTD